ncbi:unnamed protein product [Lymnaea stagnalis]|uniref:Transmembrane protein 184C n=1 Tax=Lymnaea stagnalis TaxID=6523 RepID=A0AAV2HBV0_LYMST
MECRHILGVWRKWIGFVVVASYIVLLVIAVPLCIKELERKGAPDHVQAWFIGGMFVLMALPISFWGILQHIINYTSPYLQRHIIRILWMVPIYALNAWFALRFPEAAIYLDTLRECYEAYVIYNFMAYLLSFLHHEYPDLTKQVEGKTVYFIFPLCLLPSCRNGQKFIQRCKHGVLQYTLVRPAMTIIAFFCEMGGKYDEGDFNFVTAWSYIVIISNMSQIFAMYCLVLFYRAFREELKPLRPVPKFLCVKAVVFLSFWQALLIAALAKTGAIPSDGPWIFYKNIKEVSTGIQDFVICIEMFLAAIAHYFSFSHKPFVNLAADQQNCCDSFLSMWDVRDVTGDVLEHARFIGTGVHKTLSRGKRFMTKENERTPLLTDTSQASGCDRVRQNGQPPTPAVILDAGDISDDPNKFTLSTSSMSNYAIFESSTEDQLKGLSRSVSLKAYNSGEEDATAGIQSQRLLQNQVKPVAAGDIVIEKVASQNKHNGENNMSIKNPDLILNPHGSRTHDDDYEHLDNLSDNDAYENRSELLEGKKLLSEDTEEPHLKTLADLNSIQSDTEESSTVKLDYMESAQSDGNSEDLVDSQSLTEDRLDAAEQTIVTHQEELPLQDVKETAYHDDPVV